MQHAACSKVECGSKNEERTIGLAILVSVSKHCMIIALYYHAMLAPLTETTCNCITIITDYHLRLPNYIVHIKIQVRLYAKIIKTKLVHK